jgi:hypothetical protein
VAVGGSVAVGVSARSRVTWASTVAAASVRTLSGLIVGAAGVGDGPQAVNANKLSSTMVVIAKPGLERIGTSLGWEPRHPAVVASLGRFGIHTSRSSGFRNAVSSMISWSRLVILHQYAPNDRDCSSCLSKYNTSYAFFSSVGFQVFSTHPACQANCAPSLAATIE